MQSRLKRALASLSKLSCENSHRAADKEAFSNKSGLLEPEPELPGLGLELLSQSTATHLFWSILVVFTHVQASSAVKVAAAVAARDS